MTDPQQLTDIAFAGAAAQARMLAQGTLTAPKLLELYLNRIERLDPQLKAYRIVLAHTARTEAIAAQRRLGTGAVVPLLGVPVAIKDDTDVAGEVTTMGTSAYGPAATQDAEVCRRLREGGAVIIGKTAVPELCIWPFTETVTFGATRNPWDTTRTPGGSSGGSAAAWPAGLSPIAHGSDGGGSIRIPATWCGLFGIKPQRDRVSLAPNHGVWHGLSVNGPLSRTVEDAAVFLDAPSALPVPEGVCVAAAARGPGRLRIALSTKVPPPIVARVGRSQRAALDDAAAVLRELGHQVIRRDPDYPVAALVENFIPRLLRGVHDEAAKTPRPDSCGAGTREMARLGGLISYRRMAAVQAGEAAVAARVLSIFDDVDVVMTPGPAVGPSRIGAYQRRGGVATLALVSARVPFEAVCNVTGQPAAVVPWGLDNDGLPRSVQLIGRPFDEATLLALSAQIEAGRPWAQQRPPVQ